MERSFPNSSQSNRDRNKDNHVITDATVALGEGRDNCIHCKGEGGLAKDLSFPSRTGKAHI